MIEVADNANNAGPGRGQSEAGASSGARRAFTGKRVVLGIGLLLLAVLLWSLRDTVPTWLASSMAATVELATTNERDDARVTRAFEAAMRSQAVDATLEVLPNQTKVRHSRLTVRAPGSNEAIEQASRLAVVMAAAFKNEGDGTLSIDIRRRTTPVADHATAIAGTAMSAAATVAGLLGVLLLAAAWLRLQSGPDRLPQPFWWLAAGGLALALAPMFLPGDIIMALFFMAIPALIAGIIVWKAMQLRQAASWPSTRARIIKSKIRAQHHRHAADVTRRQYSRHRIRVPPGRPRLPRHARRPGRDRRRRPRSDAQPLSPRRHGARLLRSEESLTTPSWSASRRCRSPRLYAIAAGVLVVGLGDRGGASGTCRPSCRGSKDISREGLPARPGILRPGRSC